MKVLLLKFQKEENFNIKIENNQRSEWQKLERERNLKVEGKFQKIHYIYGFEDMLYLYEKEKY